ncbi:MAG: hypothetical protein AAF666_15325 [Pseudomonadota bacterium]
MSLTEIESELAPETLDQLRAVPIVKGHPLIAVDVDDTLVVFVDHLDRFIRTLGFEMRLVTYQLEGTMFPIGSDEALPFDDCIGLINRFFEEQALEQEPILGGVDALLRLSSLAQIVILTNVPRRATKDRRRNLDHIGLPYPLVVNSGGKGRAMAWLAEHAAAPTALVDDSVSQMQSASIHAPGVIRIHFAGVEHVRRIFPSCEHATAQVHDWAACEERLVTALGL